MNLVKAILNLLNGERGCEETSLKMCKLENRFNGIRPPIATVSSSIAVVVVDAEEPPLKKTRIRV